MQPINWLLSYKNLLNQSSDTLVETYIFSLSCACFFTAYNSASVAVSEEKLSFPLPGPHVQWRASGEAALPQEDSNGVRKQWFDVPTESSQVLVLFSLFLSNTAYFYSEVCWVPSKCPIIDCFEIEKVMCQRELNKLQLSTDEN